MRNLKLQTVIGALTFASLSTLAQSLVTDRNSLNEILGPGAINEGFETPTIAFGGGTGGYGFLSSTNSPGQWGPDLLVPGINLEAADPNPNNYTIWWNGDGSGAGDSQSLMADVSLRLDFWQPTTAFGLDLRNYQGNVNLAGISVYGADRTTLLYQNNAFSITDALNGNFFGYTFAGGIGSVLFTVTSPGPNYTYKSPAIDNLSFAPIPEPSTITLGVVGLASLLAVLRRGKRS